jgi:hypothetical protein
MLAMEIARVSSDLENFVMSPKARRYLSGTLAKADAQKPSTSKFGLKPLRPWKRWSKSTAWCATRCYAGSLFFARQRRIIQVSGNVQ